MGHDLLTEAYEIILGESPVDSIDQIKSTHFTTDLPENSKYKIGSKVAITGNATASSSALAKFKVGTIGTIVGMQHNTGAGATTEYSRANGINRYYVKMPDNKIYPISSLHLMDANNINKNKLKKVHSYEVPQAKPIDDEFDDFIANLDENSFQSTLGVTLTKAFRSIPNEYKNVFFTAIKQASQ